MRRQKLAKCLIITGILIVGVTLCFCKEGFSQTSYKLGISQSVTGPAAVSYAAIGEGIQLYFSMLNDKGGINGRKIDIIFEDNAGMGEKAGANVKRFAGAGVHLITLGGPSGVYAAAFEEARRANIPVFVNTIGPMETIPPKNDPLIFGQCWGNAFNASMIIAHMIKEEIAPKGVPVVWGIVGVDVPVARKGAEFQGKLGEQIGMKTIVKISSLGTMDYTPIATSLMDAGCNVVSTWAGAGTCIGVFRALSKLGYKGIYYVNVPEAPEDFIDLLKESPSIIYTHPDLIPFWANLPEDEVIKNEAKKRGVRIRSTLKHGWRFGMTIEETFKRAGWPVTTEKLLSVLNSLDLNFGPAFPPIKFTVEDHQGPVYENGWSWNPKTGKFEVVLPWFKIDAAGKKIDKYEKSVYFPQK